MIAVLASMLATFFRKKKLPDVRGLFGKNVFKTPTRYLISLFAKPKTEIDNPFPPLTCQSRRLFRILIQEPKNFIFSRKLWSLSIITVLLSLYSLYKKANKHQKTVLQKKIGCLSVYVSQMIEFGKYKNRCGKHPRTTMLLKICVAPL